MIEMVVYVIMIEEGGKRVMLMTSTRTTTAATASNKNDQDVYRGDDMMVMVMALGEALKVRLVSLSL